MSLQKTPEQRTKRRTANSNNNTVREHSSFKNSRATLLRLWMMPRPANSVRLHAERKLPTIVQNEEGRVMLSWPVSVDRGAAKSMSINLVMHFTLSASSEPVFTHTRLTPGKRLTLSPMREVRQLLESNGVIARSTGDTDLHLTRAQTHRLIASGLLAPAFSAFIAWESGLDADEEAVAI